MKLRRLPSAGALVALAFQMPPAVAQSSSAVALPTTAPASVDPAMPPVAPPQDIVLLKRDTPVLMMAPSEVRSDIAPTGTRFKLRLHEAIKVGDRVIAPVGTPAWGEVLESEKSGGLGKAGALSARLVYIKLGDAEIPLDGNSSARGTGSGSAALAVAFTGVVGLFHRGNNAKIKAGELLNGFISEDVYLDLSSPQPRRVSTAPVPAAPVSNEPAGQTAP